jgi:hypothetical protein
MRRDPDSFFFQMEFLMCDYTYLQKNRKRSLRLVSRSQTIKIRKVFLFVLIDDLLIYSLISRAVVKPRYYGAQRV